ncbi:hypothetical protein HPB47_010902 [Ixodes persulcatus]|uniref:Uncharacterized protein n=1 Tax=Ixodes persulcatus TaxID=34615 RepID=A0AC60NXT2_IXOPE|nr:hypothetical protein HPB47_010902 [Ixodes persulcatus]
MDVLHPFAEIVGAHVGTLRDAMVQVDTLVREKRPLLSMSVIQSDEQLVRSFHLCCIRFCACKGVKEARVDT